MTTRYITINTTSFAEENFNLVTTLTPDQIKRVIMPIVTLERDGGKVYDNDDLLNALTTAYPQDIIELFYTEFETLSI